jgi:endonuclease YncB( thermonuclease family)
MPAADSGIKLMAGRGAFVAFGLSLVFGFAAVANAASVSAADGDSFRMDGQRYRLQDIDAPELHQTCKDAAGREWSCGRQARDELRKLLNQGALNCQRVTRDRFGRFVATCNVAGRDVGETMVRNGWATAYKGRGFSSRYVSAETEARSAKRGMWAGSFEAPRQWRQGHPRDDDNREILSRDAQDWVRRKAEAVSNWVRSLWTSSPQAR